MDEYRWVVVDAGGRELGVGGKFETQSEAEAWMVDKWAALAEEGGERVRLARGDEVIYEMGLGPGDPGEDDDDQASDPPRHRGAPQ